jgi:hypothetical protein
MDVLQACAECRFYAGIMAGGSRSDGPVGASYSPPTNRLVVAATASRQRISRDAADGWGSVLAERGLWNRETAVPGRP